MGQLIRFPIERATPSRRSAPRASSVLPELAFCEQDAALHVEQARNPRGVGEESLDLALAALDAPCERTFADALGLLAIARLTATEAAFHVIELALLERLLSGSLPLARRERIAEAFAALLGREALNALLVPHLVSGDAATRRLVATALGGPDNRSAFAPLVEALYDGDPEVGVAAAIALANIGHPRTLDAFQQVLAACPPRALRVAILRRLRALPPSAAEQTALAHLEDGDAEVRLAAAMALDPPVSREAQEAVCRLMADADDRVRVLAVALVEQVEVIDPVATLAPALRDSAPRVRRVAHEAVQRLMRARRAGT